MSFGKIADVNFTKTIRSLVNRIHDETPVRDSLYEQAMDYFAEVEELDKQKAFAAEKLEKARSAAENNDNDSEARKLQIAVEKAQTLSSDVHKEQEAKRLTRLDNVHKICNEILDVLEGTTEEEYNNYTSKTLGTLQLISPIEGRHVAATNQKTKHLYKTVLCIRLLDDLVQSNLITNNFVVQKYQEHQQWKTDKSPDKPMRSPFRTDVQIPLMIASIFQDIGHFHPEARAILKGPEGNLNEFRALEKDDRNALLKISYQQALRYTTYGLGMESYKGNSKEEREQFVQKQNEKLKFTRTLLKSAVNPEQGVGNLLKVPQVYCSVIMSTKLNYSYESLPRTNLVMEKGAELGAFSKAVSEALIKITGHFPQGFGITYIPKDSDKQDLDKYEYAIVVGLYPEKLDLPTCRLATRNLTFNAFGVNIIVNKDNNLFFPVARKKLERVSPKRLEEILQKLWSNYEERKDLELIPKCWYPREFFTYQRFQNLWNKANTVNM